MKQKSQKHAEKTETIRIDSAEQSVGRTASQAAKFLLGKHRPDFTRRGIPPTKVVIQNTDKLIFTGRKTSQKKYYRHSGRLGRLKETTLETLFQSDSREVMRKAVQGMLPRNRLLKLRMKQLTILRSDRSENSYKS